MRQTEPNNFITHLFSGQHLLRWMARTRNLVFSSETMHSHGNPSSRVCVRVALSRRSGACYGLCELRNDPLQVDGLCCVADCGTFEPSVIQHCGQKKGSDEWSVAVLTSAGGCGGEKL